MSDEVPLDRPVLLTSEHIRDPFDCGVVPLNEYLQKYSLQNQQNRSARTYVATRGTRVVGYYTLTAGSVNRSETPDRIAKGLANHPVPIILLARLAADQSEQGKGLGKALLKDALIRVAQAADLIGCRALLVHAKDESAKNFYLRFGFEPSPTNELHLFLLMKDLEANLKEST
jgi:GNAT superfamily N-acetyltransferase